MASRPLVVEDEAGESAIVSDGDVQRLRFAPQILRRLGEELNPNPDQGVLELVRNAYDADATRCQVVLEDIGEPGGTIRVRDWGDGLDRRAVRDGWLVLGRSPKLAGTRTPLGRLQVGQKGLGRLAALRLGSRAVLRTWPKSKPTAKRTRREHEVVLDWKAFDAVQVVEDVPVPIKTTTVEPTECGTEIIITDLRRRWTRSDVKRLARALLLLADPFGAGNSFAIELVCEEYPDLESLVAGSYFDYSVYSIRARLGEDGRASVHLEDKRLGLDEHVAHEQITDRSRDGEPYATLPADFELFGFVRSGEALHGMGTAATLEGLRAWLDSFGGVHVYHRGLRVAPYGDEGFDWLEMNLLRTRNPEFRPSTKTSVGRMLVEDSDNVLVQKTDRSGFIEDERFQDLRAFGQDVLEWAGRRRTKVADDQRERDRQQGPQRRASAREKLEDSLKKLPRRQRTSVASAVRQFERAAEKDAEELRRDLLLYRTLATIGTTSATIAHETYNPALTIIDRAREVRDIGEEDIGEPYELIKPEIDQIEELARRLRGYARLPRVLLAEPKRRTSTFHPDRLLLDTVGVFAPLFERHKVHARTELNAASLRLRGPSALVDAILANLLINAVRALDGVADRERQVVVRTSAEDDALRLEVLDNGPGIQELDSDEVWVPGATTTPEGTGLGLTIVRDSARQLGGSADVVTAGELGGAHFTIRLPRAV